MLGEGGNGGVVGVCGIEDQARGWANRLDNLCLLRLQSNTCKMKDARVAAHGTHQEVEVVSKTKSDTAQAAGAGAGSRRGRAKRGKQHLFKWHTNLFKWRASRGSGICAGAWWQRHLSITLLAIPGKRGASAT